MTVIGVCSGKGSPGATFVAVNLAAAFSSGGRDPILIDLDPNGGDVAGYLGLDPRKGLYPLSLPGQGGFSAETLEREIEVRAGLSCIAGFPNPTDVEPQTFEIILKSAGRGGRLVVADLGRVDRRCAEVAVEMDLVLLVVRPDLISIHGAQRAKQALTGAGVSESRVRLVVSGRERKHPADVGEISEAVGIEAVGMIPIARRQARKTLRNQLPITQGRAARAFAKLATRTAGEPQREMKAAPEAAVA
jgi:MinD-like ATPase involved in chromosome partitioning or flagellar assembly